MELTFGPNTTEYKRTWKCEKKVSESPKKEIPTAQEERRFVFFLFLLLVVFSVLGINKHRSLHLKKKQTKFGCG